MNLKDFIVNVVASLIFGFVIIGIISFYLNKITAPDVKKYQTPAEVKEQVRYLRDSFEMEYYKKQLDSTYLFDHSKITQ